MKTTYRCFPAIDFSLDIQADSEDEALAKMESLIEKAINNLNADLCDLGFVEGGGVCESFCTDEWTTGTEKATRSH